MKKKPNTLKKKLKIFFGFFNINNLKKEVISLGYSITTKSIVFVAFGIIMAAFIAGYLFRLRPAYLGMLIAGFILCLPSLVIMRFKHSYQMTRFNEVTDYMEQLIYAFHKNGKIRDSLVDVNSVSTGKIKEITGKMIDIIDNDMSTSKIFEKAFDLMQEEYDCARLRTLHQYLLEVEYSGGKSTLSLNVLLEDIREWSERTIVYQSERKNVQNKVLLSVFLAMLSCGIMINMIPAEYATQIVAHPIYQVATTIILMLCILTYVYASRKVCVSYLDNEVDKITSEYALQCAEAVVNYRKKNHKKDIIIRLCMFIPLIILSYFMGYRFGVLVIAVLMVVSILSSSFKNMNHIKTVVREINKAFPVWMRNMVLYLQTDNVHVSIRKSYDTCPEILKPEIKALIENIQEEPGSMKPYSRFLDGYEVPNLKLAVTYLYSIAQFGSENMLMQLDYLIQQNAKLTIAEERVRNDDSLAGFSMLMLAPMILAVFKLLLDLMLFISMFMGILGSYV